MAVFTTLDENDISQFIDSYGIGDLIAFKGISDGIENSNYFITTSSHHLAEETGHKQQGEYVLTLLEELPAEHLPFHVRLLDTLSGHGLPVPYILRNHNGEAIGCLRNKPAIIATRLPGRHATTPDNEQCAAVGQALADIHLAAAELPDNHRGIRDRQWFQSCIDDASVWLNDHDQQWVQNIFSAYKAIAADDLPQGIIHGDLFRDNVFFQGNKLTGIIDFYNAGAGHLLFDIAVAVNDWCRNDSGIDQARMDALTGAYNTRRALTDKERKNWPLMLKVSAMRFWLSRILANRSYERHNELYIEKDPEQFLRLLQWHCRNDSALTG